MSVPQAKAQSLMDIQFQYQQALNQLVELLLKRIAELQAQVLALQAVQTSIVWPRNIEQATNKNVVEEGLILPSVKLEARAQRWVRLLTHEFEDRWQEGKEVVVGTTNGRPDKLEILVNVGNPDDAYRPNWSCEKLGNWSGFTENYDHWELVSLVLEGKYVVRCGESEDYIIVKSR